MSHSLFSPDDLQAKVLNSESAIRPVLVPHIVGSRFGFLFWRTQFPAACLFAWKECSFLAFAAPLAGGGGATRWPRSGWPLVGAWLIVLSRQSSGPYAPSGSGRAASVSVAAF
jgi:hypothetical protein